MPTALGTIASHRTATATTGPPAAGMLVRYDATTLALANNAAVTTWPDSSGNGRTLTAVSTGPVFHTNAQNGLAAVWFENVAASIMAGAVPAGTFQQFFAVAEFELSGFAGVYCGLLTGTGGGNNEIVLIGDAATHWFAPGGGYTYHFNGVLDASYTPPLSSVVGVMSMSAPSVWTSPMTVQLGQDRTNGGRYWYGHVCEIIGYNRVLSTVERQQVEAYLTTKWIAPAAPIPTTGLAGWWDASDAASITYGTAPAVFAWNDKSGNNRHFSQGATANQPTRNTTINGVTAVRFTSSLDQYMLQSLFAGAFTAGELFAVIQNVSESGGGWFGGFGASGTAQHYPFNDGQIYEPWGSSVRHTLGDPAASLLNPHIYNVRTASGSYVAAINSGVVFSTATNTVGFGSSVARLGNGGTSPSADSAIGEVVIYNRVLSTVERQQVESYLATKWGTSVPAFNPLSIGWHSAFWASDPGWIPPGDGALVTSWRNAGTCAANATANGVYQPTYRATYANLSGKPAVQFVSQNVMSTTSPSIGQPNHIFAVGWLDSAATAEATVCDSIADRHLLRNGRIDATMFGGGGVATVVGAGRQGAYCMAALFNQNLSTLRTNGTSYTVALDVGSSAFSSIRIGGYDGTASMTHLGAIAFFGVKDTALTAQEITDLETWAKNYYGVPIP